jgi:hypothetical protein
MDTGKAIFLGLALIALAIFATDAMRPAQAGANQIGRYNISNAGSNSYVIWVIDTSTGRYRRCNQVHNDDTCGAWLSIPQ